MTGDRQTFPVQTTSTRTRRAWQSRRTRYAAVWVVAIALTLLVGAVGWLGFRATTVLASVDRAQDHLAQATTAFGSQDLTGGAVQVTAARDELRTARRASSDPVWAVMGTAPVVGDDVAAVAAVVAASAGLLDAVEPVTAAASEVDQVAGGAPALNAVLRDPAVPAGLVLTHERALQSQALAEELSAQPLHDVVARQVQAYGEQVTKVEPMLGAAASASQLLPVVLGSDEPKELLVVVQTPAEVRSLGGLAGLVLVVRAEDGVLQVTESYAGSSVPVAEEPVVVSADLLPSYDLLGERAGRYLTNATMLPDAAQASSLLSAAHLRRGGTEADLVVLTDLGVLSGLLAVTGPVTTSDGTDLTAGTSDTLLQFGVYAALSDPAAQDAFFAEAATAVVDRLVAPGTDPVALVRTLAADVSRGRMSLWSPVAATQADIAAAGLAGDLLSDPDAVGLFLNDGTGSKLQYFLRAEAELLPTGSTGGTVRLVLTSTVTDPDDLPDYVAGGYDRLGLQRGDQRIQVLVHGAVDGRIDRWLVDGEQAPAGSAVVDDRGAGVLSVDVPAGGSVVVEVDVSGDRPLGPLVATPSVLLADPPAAG